MGRLLILGLAVTMVSVGCLAPSAGPVTNLATQSLVPESAVPTSSADLGGPSSAAPSSAATGPSAGPVDPALEPVSISKPPASAARAFEVCLVGELVARNGIGTIAGIGRIDHASDAIHYARLTRGNPELQSDSPAWVVQFRGDIRLPGGRIYIDPTCIVVEGGDGGFFGTGGVRDPVSGSASTPLPDAVSPDRVLPPPLP